MSKEFRKHLAIYVATNAGIAIATALSGEFGPTASVVLGVLSVGLFVLAHAILSPKPDEARAS